MGKAHLKSILHPLNPKPQEVSGDAAGSLRRSAGRPKPAPALLVAASAGGRGAGAGGGEGAPAGERRRAARENGDDREVAAAGENRHGDRRPSASSLPRHGRAATAPVDEAARRSRGRRVANEAAGGRADRGRPRGRRRGATPPVMFFCILLTFHVFDSQIDLWYGGPTFTTVTQWKDIWPSETGDIPQLIA